MMINLMSAPQPGLPVAAGSYYNGQAVDPSMSKSVTRPDGYVWSETQGTWVPPGPNSGAMPSPLDQLMYESQQNTPQPMTPMLGQPTLFESQQPSAQPFQSGSVIDQFQQMLANRRQNMGQQPYQMQQTGGQPAFQTPNFYGQGQMQMNGLSNLMNYGRGSAFIPSKG